MRVHEELAPMQPAATWRIARGDFAGGSRARRQFDAYLRASETKPAKRCAAELIFGELVANALTSSRTMVSVTLYEHPRVLRVVDDGDCFDLDSVPPTTPHAESGRGIHIVKALATELKVEWRDSHCCVTAVLP